MAKALRAQSHNMINAKSQDMKIFKRTVILPLMLLSASTLMAQNDAKPWTFWYWMYGAVSKAGIHTDLTAMKDEGLGGAFLMPIRSAKERPEYGGDADALTPKFWDMAAYALQQADSLGLEMGIHICDGFALAGGPWIKPEESMQQVVWTDTIVAAKDIERLAVERPAGRLGYYEDIAAYAIPLQEKWLTYTPAAVSTEGGVSKSDKGYYIAFTPGAIINDMGRTVTIRSVRIRPNGTSIQALRVSISASADGKTWKPIRQLQAPRQGWQNNGHAYTYALKPFSARYVKLSWTPEGSEPGAEDLDAAKWKPTLKLQEATFSSEPKIDNWEGKAGQEWRIAPETSATDVPDELYIQPSGMERITLRDSHATCSSIAPASLRLLKQHFKKPKYYRIMRFGHTTTGQTNATAGGAKGLEVDKFNPQAVNKQVDNWFARFKHLSDSIHAGKPGNGPVTTLHVDSWECGTQNWGYHFADEFQQTHGYDLLDWLPVMAGVPLASAEKSEQVLHDVRLLVNSLLNKCFFATVRDRAHAMGVRFTSESVAPTMVADGIDHYDYADIPMGEFWLNSPTHDKPNDMLDAISGAHIYGKNIVQAEGFTEIRGVWNETPAMLKPYFDRFLALGMNKITLHVNAHNPWTDRKPGMTLDGIGLFFQRDQTWYKDAKPMIDYMTRCQHIMQWGHPVTDIAVFNGEEMPRRALTPDRLVPMLPGLFGEKRVESERIRLANVGQPMTEGPVGVRHSAGILDLKDWINPLHGYQYDSFNARALSKSGTLNNGCFTPSANASYKIVVIPQARRMNPSRAALSAEVAKRIAQLRQGGVVVIDKPYLGADLTAYGLKPDVLLPENIAYAHRAHNGSDVYFIANQRDSALSFTAVFPRMKASKATLYDARFNRYAYVVTPVNQSGYTSVEMTLPAHGSLFVFFGTDRPMPLSTESLLPTQPGRQAKALKPLQPWSVLLKENGKNMAWQQLTDWSKSSDDSVRYFSGHAVYQTTFRSPQSPASATRLWLGEVHDVASVWVNGIYCGTAWTEPYCVEIGKALRKGTNNLRIEVVNTWANALCGADSGKAPYSGIWTNARYRFKGDALLPAGLLGPLKID